MKTLLIISLHKIIGFLYRSCEKLLIVIDIRNHSNTSIALNDSRSSRIFMNYLWVVIVNRRLNWLLLLLLLIWLLIKVILKSILIVLLDHISKLIILHLLIDIIVNLNILLRSTLRRSTLRLIRTMSGFSKVVFTIASSFKVAFVFNVTIIIT